MKYLIEIISGRLCFGIAIENVAFNTETHKIIETDLQPNFIVNRWNGQAWEEMANAEEITEFNKPKIQNEISRAEFYYGLRLQGAKPSDVLDFIENHIENVALQIKAEILFTQATVFEYQNEILNLFVGGFNQYLQMAGKTPIVFDDIFINGITLNQ